MKTLAMQRIRAWTSFLQKLGPYLLLEIVLPGGTLIALLLFLYQRRQFTDAGAEVPALVSALGTLRALYRRFAPHWLKARARSLCRSCTGARRTGNRMSPACRTFD